MKPILATIDNNTEPAEVDFTVAYSGGKLMLPDWDLPLVIDLATATVHDNIPILLYHSGTRRVGTVKAATVEPDKIRLSGIIIRALPDAQTVLAVHRDGGAWECSIGTAPAESKDIELIQSGSITINGQTIDAPVYVLHNAEIREISFVSAGADSQTQLEIRASMLQIKDTNTMDYTDEKFREFVEYIGVDFDSLDDDAKEDVYKTWTYRKVKDVEEPAVEAACEPEKTVEAEVTDEHKGEFKEEYKDEDKKVEASGLSNAQRRVNAIRTSNLPSMTRYNAPSEKRIIEASMLLQHADGSQVERAGYSQAEINEAMSANYRNIGLHGFMRRAILASGQTLPMDCSSRELVRTYREIQASGLSTRDFSPSGIMSNVVDRMLRIQADTINTVADKVLYRRSVNDFKKVVSGKLNIYGDIPEVLPGEDFTNVGLADDSQDYKIAKRGVNLTITIEDQINDDLGAFERALTDFGRLFANTVDSVAIGSLVSQSNTIFTGNKKKTLAFSAENLKTVCGAFQRIKDPAGHYRNLIPGAILTSPETAVAARALFVFNDKASIAPQTSTEVMTAAYNVYGTPYIETAGGWYLLPRDEYIGELASLNGETAPKVEQATLNTKNLNIEFVVWGTCGVLIYNDAPAVWSKPA